MTLRFEDVQAAAAALQGQVLRTPCLFSRTLSTITGAKIWLKFENLQFTASFKERGAFIKLSSLTEKERKAGVIAMSAGNHAQGVAYHAQRLGIPATIIMPSFTPFVKVRHTKSYGARVILHGDSLAESASYARDLAAKEGLTFVHPYDDERIMAGQGTVALEMLTDAPDIDTLVIPVGGGGLIGGCAVAAKGIKPDIEIIGVETERYPAAEQMLHAKPVQVPGGVSIAEGIAVRDIGEKTFAVIKEQVKDILIVGEADIERAITMLLEIEKTVAEGAGAAGLAGVLAHPDKFKGKAVGIILCGGNIDTRLLASILMRGLVRDSRLVELQIDIPDAPGTLSKITGLVGSAGGNIVDVFHQRLFGVTSAKSAELDLVIETRDEDHVAELVGLIENAGYSVRRRA